MLLPKIGIERLIYNYLEENKEDKRNYMGASILGDDCPRKVWYNYKLESIFPARVKLIFEAGKIFESLVVDLLRKSGLTVYDKDDNGEQFGFVDGVLAGHYDGVVTGLPESTEPHLLEIKSANDKSFGGFCKNGLKRENQNYFYQMQCYMHYAKLENGLFIVINKNNCELYFERVKYDEILAGYIINRAKEIAAMGQPPEREYKSKTFYKCKFCNHARECWK